MKARDQTHELDSDKAFKSVLDSIDTEETRKLVINDLKLDLPTMAMNGDEDSMELLEQLWENNKDFFETDTRKSEIRNAYNAALPAKAMTGDTVHHALP